MSALTHVYLQSCNINVHRTRRTVSIKTVRGILHVYPLKLTLTTIGFVRLNGGGVISEMRTTPQVIVHVAQATEVLVHIVYATAPLVHVNQIFPRETDFSC